MTQTKANAKSQMQDAGQNPYGNQAVAGGQVVFLALTFETGRNPDVDGLLDAIETFYGAGKISNDVDTATRSNYRLRVAA